MFENNVAVTKTGRIPCIGLYSAVIKKKFLKYAPRSSYTERAVIGIYTSKVNSVQYNTYLFKK